ncbi:hypothetical protein RDI86_02125 [Cellulosimicrobium sp. XJ-DQ-B-000]|uniref:hypothetical protein n=1 Tax=Cellulosimicrobium sp. XJ-DQ-B-000 TaxID=3072182 RepID=UPI0028070738|nr:hypothetical protein [Cellulosimicrobium sp. XJ-DQ-B-000]MDQ8040645.1 hypothetical protein [Cellulosimicrobium sp. XJ-DQ-B-000]
MTAPTGWSAEMDRRMREIETDAERYLEDARRDASSGRLSKLLAPSGSARGRFKWKGSVTGSSDSSHHVAPNLSYWAIVKKDRNDE